MRILSAETAAVIVDVQQRLFPHMHEKESLETKLNTLIRGLKLLAVPLIVTQQYSKGLGPAISSLQEALGWAPAHDRENFIEKIAFSCWDEPVFRQALEATERKRILLAGIEAHVCMLQTAVDLQAAGYTPVVLEDCTSSRRAGDKLIAFQRLAREGILVSTCESILFELTRSAGTDTFKAISRLVK